MINRIFTFYRRWNKARSIGIRFQGTRRFRMPQSFHRDNHDFKIVSPDDGALALDFINLILDDEYGLEQLDPAPRSILDIGANIGLFSLHAWTLYPNTAIHAYEPNPELTPYLQSNLQPTGAQIFPEAVGASAGRVRMIDSLSSRTNTVEHDGPIIQTSIAQAIQRLGGNIDLLKLDCEGAEWDIFQDHLSLQHVQRIRMEYHLLPGRTLDDFRRLVKGCGFHMDYLNPNQNFGICYLSRCCSQ